MYLFIRITHFTYYPSLIAELSILAIFCARMFGPLINYNMLIRPQRARN
jgi:hypothetical protein